MSGPRPAKRARVAPPADSIFADTFASFRAELDDHHDRRERIVKISRDITAQSKKAIFALQRVSSAGRTQALHDADERFADIRKLFDAVAPELEGENFFRYQRSVSPGIQEYLEAALLYAHLQAGVLPSPSELQVEIPSAVLLTPEDFLGGVADLSGELMRIAVANVGRSLRIATEQATKAANAEVATEDGEAATDDNMGGEDDEPPSVEEVLNFVRALKGELDYLAPYVRWLPRKISVLNQSLSKIENARYALQIRGAEYAHAPEMLERLAKDIMSARQPTYEANDSDGE